MGMLSASAICWSVATLGEVLRSDTQWLLTNYFSQTRLSLFLNVLAVWSAIVWLLWSVLRWRRALAAVLRLMAEKKASDVFLSAKTPILIKINGQIKIFLGDTPSGRTSGLDRFETASAGNSSADFPDNLPQS